MDNLTSGVIDLYVQGGVLGTVTNAGTITGGVNLSSGTLVNSGTMREAYVGSAAYSPGGLYNDDRLVLYPDASLAQAHSGNTVTSVLQLASGASSGTLAGVGTAFRNFATITFDTGAAWTIAGQPSGLTSVMTGFAQGDTIDLVGVSETISNFAAGVLTLTGDQTVMLNLPGTFAAGSFQTATDGSTGTDVFLACYVRGTRIATLNGEVAVEALAEGDQVMLASGEIAPIVWIGRRRLDCRRHPQPHQIWPVRVCAHAFGHDLPRRDLLLSPNHAVFVDDVLIPVRYLINGTTIRQEACAGVDYFHVDLPRHAVLLAEGLPAESYLDTGDRASFENAGLPITLHPDFSARRWDAEGCAPLVVTGPILDAVRARLNERCGSVAA